MPSTGLAGRISIASKFVTRRLPDDLLNPESPTFPRVAASETQHFPEGFLLRHSEGGLRRSPGTATSHSLEEDRIMRGRASYGRPIIYKNFCRYFVIAINDMQTTSDLAHNATSPRSEHPSGARFFPCARRRSPDEILLRLRHRRHRRFTSHIPQSSYVETLCTTSLTGSISVVIRHKLL
ncbi:hypothetical protein D9611_012244 [Ephemerocybe angulata]|uniref:Uncharacterized protein n=1 Tax=Ephemerocybe angulata TaxID=980116 RepID=A0A8H5AT70_9AGAR|nr:hypothetical protein D9611_012244 [Tulosesus angulatus]